MSIEYNILVAECRTYGDTGKIVLTKAPDKSIPYDEIVSDQGCLVHFREPNNFNKFGWCHSISIIVKTQGENEGEALKKATRKAVRAFNKYKKELKKKI